MGARQSANITREDDGSYQFEPLKTSDSIRIFKLCSGVPSDPIHVKLYEHLLQPARQIVLDGKPSEWATRVFAATSRRPEKLLNSYEALSYRCGDPTAVRKIFCNGKELQIYHNLHVALRRLRPVPGQPSRKFWACQICINQSDIIERSSQVRLMSRIFQEARQVIAFLGDEDSHMEKAIELAKRLSELPDTPSTVHENWELLERAALPQSLGPFDDPETAREDEAWVAWRKFFSSAWFGRAWIAQEALLPRGSVEVVCGSFRVDLEMFYRAERAANPRKIASSYTCVKSDGLDQSSLIRGIKFLRMLNRIGIMYQNGQKLDIEDLLTETRETEATDPRDKLFAFTGMANDGDAPELQADYTLSSEEVMIRIARHCLRTGQKPTHPYSILYQCDENRFSPEAKLLNLPSWVPDWSHSLGSSRICGQIRPECCAGGRDQFPDIKVLEGDDLLELNGRVLGYIRTLAYSARGELSQHASPAYEHYGGLLEAAILASCLKEYPTGETVLEAFWRTCTANKGSVVISADSLALTDSVEASPEMVRLAMAGVLCAMYTNDERDREQITRFIQSLKDIANAYFEDPIIQQKMFLWRFVPATRNLLDLRINGLAAKFRDELSLSIMFEKPTKQVQTIGDLFKGMCLFINVPGRTLCLTDNGYMGIVPVYAQDGDQICVFDGAYTPWVVRKVGAHYKLVGSCYLHGFMKGEAYVDDEQYPPQKILIC